MHAPFQHSEIVATTQGAIEMDEGRTIIIIEYRADGCVTWRKA